MRRGPIVVVVFADHRPVVARLNETLLLLADEILEHDAELLFVNDRPEDSAWAAALDVLLRRLATAGVAASVLKNECGLGEVRSSNLGLAVAKSARRDALLIRGDTGVHRGFLDEVIRIARLDPMIGFVCPRSNHAGIYTLPATGAATRAENEHPPATGRRPDFSFVPTGTGNCLFVKAPMMLDFGLLDEAYGSLALSQDDYILRASQCGYRVALSNRAYLQDETGALAAAATEPNRKQHASDLRLLNSRYPEYGPLVNRYITSPAASADLLASKVPNDVGDGYSVLFDFSSFGLYHSGTVVAGKQILLAASQIWPKHISIHVRMEPDAFEFHQLNQIGRITHWRAASEHDKCAVIIRFGQIFDLADLAPTFERAPIVLNFMLDTIAHDCAGLTMALDPMLWSFVGRWSDAILTNSNFTSGQIASRFAVDPCCRLVSLLHSTDPAEYAIPGPKPDSKRSHLLVIGSKFPHKFVDQTVELLLAQVTDERIVCIGAMHKQSHPRVTVIESGGLTDAQMAKLYGDAKVVIFPSHYEGFGFPILNALAASTPIVARDMPVYREIMASIDPVPEIHFFQSIDQIPGILLSSAALETGGHAAQILAARTWQDSARDILEICNERLAAFEYGRLLDRLTWLAAISTPGKQRKANSFATLASMPIISRLIAALKRINHRRVRYRRSARLGKAMKAATGESET
jgi:hypothetical protein